MNSISHRFFIGMVSLLLICSGLYAQQFSTKCQTTTTIDSILLNPGEFQSAKVTVRGHLQNFTPPTDSTTAFYLLKSMYGELIKVNTAKPEGLLIGEEYCVTGIINISVQNEILPFITELERSWDNGWWPPSLMQSLLLILIALIIVLGAMMVVKYFGSREPRKRKIRKSFDTVTIYLTPDTMMYLPGKLEIVSDCVDKGKTFQIAARPTADGNVVTIGRKHEKGDRIYSHIQTGDKYRTVSREQAEIIERDDNLYLKSIGEKNITRLNGTEIPVGTEKVLNNGDKIQIGELTLKYLY